MGNMKPWRDQWPRFNDNGGRDGSWETYAFRRSGYTLGNHDIQYKFRCTVQQHNGHHCSYLRMCIGSRGSPVRNSDQRNSRCNHDWRQLPQRHLDAPDYVMCSVNTPHMNPDGEMNRNPLSLKHNYNV